MTEPSSKKTISFVIRTLNEAKLVGRCLDTLIDIGGDYDLDFVFVDSGSTDDTLEIVSRYPARVLHIAKEDFDYSKSLNMGLEVCRGEFCVILSAHCIPREKDWLEKMLAPFSDDRVAGTGCRQVPWPDAAWDEVARLMDSFGEESRTYSREAGDAEGLFSNAASCLRMSVWREHPFTLPAVEDLEWSKRVIGEGWKIVYDASISVYHSHYETPRQIAKRVIAIAQAADIAENRRRSFPMTLKQGIGNFGRDSKKILRLRESWFRKGGYLWNSFRAAFWYVVDFKRVAK